MKRKITLSIAAVAAALSVAALGAAFGGTSSASPLRAPKGAAIVALRTTALGKVVVNAHGRTLYLFEKDKNGRSACSGACAAYWPPLFTTAKTRAGSGVRASLLGMTKRADGRRQVTYAGHPLYTVITDTTAGQTTGEGVNTFGGTWNVVAASGREIKSSTSTAPGSGGSSGGYGGGYGR